MAEVSEQSGDIDGLPVVWRSAPTATAPEAPVPLYLHGVPNTSRTWESFLTRSGGVAVDLPGYGRSGKPGHFDYTIEGYADFLERFTELAELQRVSLVMHDWGGVGLAWAQRHPERVHRLVIIDAVPLLPGYRWHRIARVWRTPVLGELAMGATTRRVLRLLSRESNAARGPMPDEFLDEVLEHFDHGTQRAILRLYRSAPPDVLSAAGQKLGELRCPALVVWGRRDPYIPARFADDYARALGGPAEAVVLDDAGHWPWLDDPALVDRVTSFLAGS